MTTDNIPNTTKVIDLANRVEPYLSNLLWAIGIDLGCEDGEDDNIERVISKLRDAIIRGYRNQEFSYAERSDGWNAVLEAREILKQWDGYFVDMEAADRAAIWNEIVPPCKQHRHDILKELNGPWHGMYEPRGELRVAVIRDSNLKHLAYSHEVTKEEARSHSPTLDTFRLMMRTPQVLAALRNLLDAIGNAPFSMLESSLRDAVYEARAVVADLK
jgi:hypothetical protein